MERTVIGITRDEFYKNYGPQKNHLDDDADWDGILYEVFGKERDFCRLKSLENKVWTIIECDDLEDEFDDDSYLEEFEDEDEYIPEAACLYIVSGYHITDAIGFIVTAMPYEEGLEIEVKINI